MLWRKSLKCYDFYRDVYKDCFNSCPCFDCLLKLKFTKQSINRVCMPLTNRALLVIIFHRGYKAHGRGYRWNIVIDLAGFHSPPWGSH